MNSTDKLSSLSACVGKHFYDGWCIAGIDIIGCSCTPFITLHKNRHFIKIQLAESIFSDNKISPYREDVRNAIIAAIDSRSAQV